MIRRKFLTSAAASTAIPATWAATKTLGEEQETSQKELYELRTYEMRFRGNRQLLTTYLKDVYEPALRRAGANQFMMFGEYGKTDPFKLWLLISYPTADVYLACQNLRSDTQFVSEGQSYDGLGPEQTIFNRYESSLLLAFGGLPKMVDPIDGAGLFELRTYEGYSEDAVRRKILMFDKEEIELFFKVKLNPVFFGDMIAGPYRPALAYMLNFSNMAERDANWQVFFDHPDWKQMLANPAYANTVSHIRRQFLVPL